MWTIRPAQVKDARKIQQHLHKAYRPIKKYGFNMEAVDVSVKRVEESIREDELYVIADEDDCIWGTVRLQDNDETRDTLSWFSIAPELKGQGLGKMLFEFAQERAKERGRKKLYLDTAKDHPWLPDMYRRWGCKEIGTIRWPGQNFDAVQFEIEL